MVTSVRRCALSTVQQRGNINIETEIYHNIENQD